MIRGARALEGTHEKMVGHGGEALQNSRVLFRIAENPQST